MRRSLQRVAGEFKVRIFDGYNYSEDNRTNAVTIGNNGRRQRNEK